MLKYFFNVIYSQTVCSRGKLKLYSCYKIRDAIGVARVWVAILTQERWFDQASSSFCAYTYIFTNCVCLRARGRPRLANRSFSVFHTNLILQFSCYFQIFKENLIWSFTKFCMSFQFSGNKFYFKIFLKIRENLNNFYKGNFTLKKQEI